ncbi:FAD-dependent oxidoreductase [Yinghuangia soli]|uniref:FAD-dependent monooxygenase n=1 Tax=Yinghuangia soli TaxID=2908204 RepID=A0AA41Q3W4_9ACTN|nr:FAD-dependent monooxygenase [Yinghuangia soli]MCF2531063.1 FAD-dependent monooxygenase [Yinghuangia soli]
MSPGYDERVPVLVAGGSLVGLSASVFLGRLGVRHLVVERHTGTSTHPRGRGNNVRTMELFRTAGIEQGIRAASAVLAGNHGILQADTIAGAEQEWLVKDIDPGGGLAKFSPSSWCLCSQNDLEPVLVRYAAELGSPVRFGTELVAFDQDPTGVTAVLEDRATGQRRTVRADYLVAADGPRSPVREHLGIGTSGPGDLFHNVSITFTSKRLAEFVGDRRFIVCYLTTPLGEGALLPVDNLERWVFHAPWHPEEGEPLDAFTDERCIAHIRAAAGVADLDVQITGTAPWHAAERVADRYRDGRVFLAGDSAHEMSPTGAFGSNTGIQDAHNLAWKLAAVLNGHARPELLDSYEAERRPVALATAARASTRSAEHSHPGYAPTGPGGPGQPGGDAAPARPDGPPKGSPAEHRDRPDAGRPPGAPGAAPGGPPGAGRPGGPPGAGRPGGPPGGPPGGAGRQPGVLGVVLGYRYTAGAVVGADTDAPVLPEGFRPPDGAPGTRAPHLWVRREGERVSLLDLYESRFVLLTGAGTAGQAWRHAATGLGADIDVYGLQPDRAGISAATAADLVTDEDADWADVHGVHPGGAVLVRPDGFVAWRSPDAASDCGQVLRDVAAALRRRCPGAAYRVNDRGARRTSRRAPRRPVT